MTPTWSIQYNKAMAHKAPVKKKHGFKEYAEALGRGLGTASPLGAPAGLVAGPMRKILSGKMNPLGEGTTELTDILSKVPDEFGKGLPLTKAGGGVDMKRLGEMFRSSTAAGLRPFRAPIQATAEKALEVKKIVGEAFKGRLAHPYSFQRAFRALLRGKNLEPTS